MSIFVLIHLTIINIFYFNIFINKFYLLTFIFNKLNYLLKYISYFEISILFILLLVLMNGMKLAKTNYTIWQHNILSNNLAPVAPPSNMSWLPTPGNLGATLCSASSFRLRMWGLYSHGFHLSYIWLEKQSETECMCVIKIFLFR